MTTSEPPIGISQIDGKALKAAYDKYNHAYVQDLPVSEMKLFRLKSAIETYLEIINSRQPVELSFDEICEMVALSDKVLMVGSECIIRVDDAMDILKPYLSKHIQMGEEPPDADALIEAIQAAIKTEREKVEQEEIDGETTSQDSKDYGYASVAYDVIEPHLSRPLRESSQPDELPPLSAYKNAQVIAAEIMDIIENTPEPYASIISCVAKALPVRESGNQPEGVIPSAEEIAKIINDNSLNGYAWKQIKGGTRKMRFKQAYALLERFDIRRRG